MPGNGVSRGWDFWIDRGGTFTDVVARRPDGELSVLKLLSRNPQQYRDAALEGIRLSAGLGSLEQLTELPVAGVRMGTTVATNALLEREGEPTVLVITNGFGDALSIGYQQRPRLFDLHIRKPEPLYTRVVEARERVAVDGEVIRALDEAHLATELAAAHTAGYRAAAIVFMHGYRYADHENRAAELARAAGFEQVSMSHDTSPLPRLVMRGDTTVADAYLSPVLGRYVADVEARLEGQSLFFMQSNGGLTAARTFRGRDSVLSGPAGGVVGMVQTGIAAGYERLIGFDMGGTSTDVSLYDGQYERTQDNEVAGVRIQAPMMRIHTVAAGGGSLLGLTDGRFTVGPDSAGADPGPVCYRKGTALAITDANAVLGRIQPDWFPAVFGPGADQPPDPEAAVRAFEARAVEVRAATGEEMTIESMAEGYLRIGVDRMAQAIKEISSQRGYDVTDFTLCCFGGAGGQHACAVAQALGMRRVLLHPLAGVLSAYGMGLADIKVLKQASVQEPLTDNLELETVFELLESQARSDLRAQAGDAAPVSLERRVRIRYAGSDTALELAFGPAAGMADGFAALHAERYGFREAKPMIVESAEVEGSAAIASAVGRAEPAREGAAPAAFRRVWVAGAWTRTPVFVRRDLGPGPVTAGPALIMDDGATTFVDAGWDARIDDLGNLVLERRAESTLLQHRDVRANPITLEIFNNLFMHIAEQMGVVLRNTAHSVNIKERLDFSCALFDRGGGLVANAPHMPVHLGSMGESVRAVLARYGDALAPGDSIALNDPYHGGTHLPDVTIVTPYFDRGETSPLFFVASRAHHADIGGRTPGSMPAASTSIAEEGALIDGFRLVAAGRFDEAGFRELLAAGRWPARNPDQNVADAKAQLAANQRGLGEIQRMLEAFGRPVVEAYMGHVQDNAEAAVRRALKGLSDGSFEYPMDGGQCIRAAIRIDAERGSAVVDFSGTSDQDRANFNAPLAVCRAAVLYVLRCLVDHDIPMNDGCLRPVDIRVPKGCLLNPEPPAAVVAGNVETSQCITDALFGALGVVAAAQGTMNNLTFGNGRYQYYETLCGGAGAGPGFRGADAVHTHMTNSRLTDPEVLEARYPVRLERFCLRAGSGGAGKWPGGDGVLREIRFLEPMTVSILSGHRRVAPFGLAGGEPGTRGRNQHRTPEGGGKILPGTGEFGMDAGDSVIMETPGGGGYGRKP
jgi:5-oxoprolinase (ATP-hydrolysing)